MSLSQRTSGFQVKLLPQNEKEQAVCCQAVRERSWQAAAHMADLVFGTAANPEELQQRRFNGYSPEVVLRSVRALLELGEGEALFSFLEEKLRQYTQALTRSCYERHEMAAKGEQSCGSQVAFELLATMWRHFTQTMGEVEVVWVYLYRWCAARRAASTSLESVAVHCLRDALEGYPALYDSALEGHLRAIQRDLGPPFDGSRAAEAEARGVDVNEEAEAPPAAAVVGAADERVHAQLRCFTDLSLAVQQYFSRVQPAVIATVQTHYEAQVLDLWRREVPAAAYLLIAERALQAERARVLAYMHPHTLPLLEAATEAIVLGDVAIEVLRRDFEAIMQAEDYDTLRRVWHLLCKGAYAHHAAEVRAVFRCYLEEVGGRYMQALTKRVRRRPTTASPAGQSPREAAAATPEEQPFFVTKALIALLDQGERVIQESFVAGAKEFTVQLHEALQTVLQAHPQLFSEQLAAYLDSVMKEIEGGALRFGEGSTAAATAAASSRPEAAAATLDGIAKIFSYHPSKDFFEAYYWRDLARRLLHPHRVSRVDAEEYFIRLLRSICGPSFTSRFEGMMKDLLTGAELDARYRTWVEQKGQVTGGTTDLGSAGPTAPSAASMPSANEEEPNSPPRTSSAPAEPSAARAVSPSSFVGLPDAEVRLHMLTTGYWPTCTPLPLRLPPPWLRLADNVRLFYQTAFRNRRLTWQHQLSVATLKGKLQPTGPVRQFTGTLVQCAVLYYMDARTTPEGDGDVRAGELSEALGVDLKAAEVAGSLLGLCDHRFLLLQRSGAATAGAALSADERLRLNVHFTSAASKVRLPFYTRGRNETAGEDAASISDRVLTERGYLLEVALVRYMKAHREAKHDAVIAAMLDEVRFPVTAASVKKVLEKLISRGFIERRGADNYVYLS